MQRSTAEKLRLEWGDAACEHQMIDREYNAGTATGNYVCLVCGKAFSVKKVQLLALLPFILAGNPIIEMIQIIEAFLKTL